MPSPSLRLRLENRDLFESYLAVYEELPNYKKLLRNLIKFNQMYQPIPRGSRQADPWGQLAGINEERRLRRAQIYLNEKDLIQTFDEKLGRRLVVTSRGHQIFYKDYPLAKLRQQKWDGLWTVVMYDFPEKERLRRQMIRRRLIALGFGCPQISLLVSPLPVEEPVHQLLQGERVTEKVWILRAERVLGMENWQVVQRSWPQLEELQVLYEELVEVLPQAKEEASLKEEWVRYFMAVNNADPYLPAELLPRDWSGVECERAFIGICSRGFLDSVASELDRFRNR